MKTEQDIVDPHSGSNKKNAADLSVLDTRILIHCTSSFYIVALSTTIRQCKQIIQPTNPLNIIKVGCVGFFLHKQILLIAY